MWLGLLLVHIHLREHIGDSVGWAKRLSIAHASSHDGVGLAEVWIDLLVFVFVSHFHKNLSSVLPFIGKSVPFRGLLLLDHSSKRDSAFSNQDVIEGILVPDLDIDERLVGLLESEGVIPGRELASVVVDFGFLGISSNLNSAKWVHLPEGLGVSLQLG